MRSFHLDTKSLIIGLLAGLLVMTALGGEPPVQRGLPAVPVSGGAGGGDAYELAAWGNPNGHGAFVLNTRTGELISVIGRTVTVDEGMQVDMTQKRVGLYSIQEVPRE